VAREGFGRKGGLEGFLSKKNYSNSKKNFFFFFFFSKSIFFVKNPPNPPSTENSPDRISRRHLGRSRYTPLYH
jgi:hypothetical protein